MLRMKIRKKVNTIFSKLESGVERLKTTKTGNLMKPMVNVQKKREPVQKRFLANTLTMSQDTRIRSEFIHPSLKDSYS